MDDLRDSVVRSWHGFVRVSCFLIVFGLTIGCSAQQQRRARESDCSTNRQTETDSPQLKEEFFENGSRRLLRVERIINGEIVADGLEVSWYQSGSVLSVGNYHRGKKVGQWLYFWGDNKLLSCGEYQNGERVGMWKEYSRDGALRLRTQHRKGDWKLETLYWPSGVVWSKGVLVSKSRRGVWLENYQDGRLHFIDLYSDSGQRIIRVAISKDGAVSCE